MNEIEILLAKIKERLHEAWGIDHATLEPEMTGCEQTGILGQCDRSNAHEEEVSSPSPADGLIKKP